MSPRRVLTSTRTAEALLAGAAAKAAQRDAEREAERAARAEAKRLRREGPDLARDSKAVKSTERADRIIVTSALNNAPLHTPFWRALTLYAEHVGAALVVIPARYRNPTTVEEHDTRESGWWWPAEVVPYLFANELRFHRHLVVRADLRINATATHPLQGLEGFGGGASVIVGHAQIAMKTVATPQHSLPKILHTTGSVSRPVYSESAAGARGRFHHQLGAVIIERDGDAFHLRQLIADPSGAFYDLDKLITPDAITGGQRAEALVCGDIHVGFTDPAVQRATFDGPDSLCGVTRPKRVFLHDVIDSFSISHHHEHDPIAGVAKHRAGRDSLSAEVDAVAEFLERVIPDGPEVVLVASNHHDHIAKWVLRSDWRRDPRNAETYLETALAMVRAAKVTGRGIETIDPFQWLLSQRLKRKVRFLARGESCPGSPASSCRSTVIRGLPAPAARSETSLGSACAS